MTSTAELIPGTTIMAVPPTGPARECRVDHVSENGMVVLSFPRPRGRGRFVWTKSVEWL
ncbi:hypothetical protein MBRU_12165 [Mycolicibacterium brumae DSM 44177]|nr:hypothetical protein MBRU_12165 [Mycolicibacterium brumae DSM 44177]